VKVLVLDGPNLNLLGSRQPEVYGRETLGEVHARVRARATELGVEVATFQSNHEGALIDRLHERDFDGVIVNAGGLTHTSVALLDAFLSIERPYVEVHLSEPKAREDFRHRSYLEGAAVASVAGRGPQGYVEALELLVGRLQA
jgi:3-dehydroquinate dehydratase-2